jgi:hypothetical protein
MVVENKGDDDVVIAGNSHSVDVQFDCIGDYFDTMLHVLPVNGYGGGTATVGLLLQPTGRAQGQYQRVGQFIFWDERSSREFESPARCRNVKQGNKNILRFGERKIG